MTKGATSGGLSLSSRPHPGPRNGKFNRIPGDFNNWTVNSIYIHIDWYRLLKKTPDPLQAEEGPRTPIRDRKDTSFTQSGSAAESTSLNFTPDTHPPPLYKTNNSTSRCYWSTSNFPSVIAMSSLLNLIHPGKSWRRIKPIASSAIVWALEIENV